MTRRASWLFACAAVLMVSVQCLAVENGERAPGFKAKGVDGEEYTLDSLAKDAKATIVCFTCNQCPVAVAYEDRFIEFAKKYKNKGVKFVAINVNTSENLEAMKQRAEEKGFNFPYAYDESGKSSREYGARVTPHLFVVDGNGEVAYQGAFDDDMSKPSKSYLEDAVNAILDGKTVPVAKTRAFGCGIKPKRT